MSVFKSPMERFPCVKAPTEGALESFRSFQKGQEAAARQAAFFALEKHVTELDSDKEHWTISRIVDVVLDAYQEALKA